MFRTSVSIPETSPSYRSGIDHTQRHSLAEQPKKLWLDGIRRRWARERRRRKVGRAYDMAREIAPLLPSGSRILDVGCGNGYITHHLSAMLKAETVGIDLDLRTEAAISYRQFDGKYFPIGNASVNAVLFCYVLHHAQDMNLLMRELQRVLTTTGQVIVYEDIPSVWWDRLVCWTHNMKWRKRTGPCTFRDEHEWRSFFDSVGFEILSERPLSRWRNLTHPVSRRLYVLKQKDSSRS
jgi:SAM-dependent methyltransferase